MVLLAGGAFLYFAIPRTTGKIVAVQAEAPAFKVADTAGGNTVSSEDLKGKVVFVNFWASWCQPCKEEMPSVDALFKEEAPKGNFVMITVLYKDDPATALSYMKSLGYSFPVYTDPRNNSAVAFGVTGVPETYIVDKKGVLRKKVIGPADWSSPDEKALIDSLLKE